MCSYKHCITLIAYATLMMFSTACAGEGKDKDKDKSQLGMELKPQLGEPVGEYVSSIVSPNGEGLPEGRGNAMTGEKVYTDKCQHCHGADGDQSGNQLVGGIGSLSSDDPFKTVGSFWPYATTLYDYIARAMPYDGQKSLSHDEVYAVTAYVLYLSEIIRQDEILTDNNIAKVQMPNRNGFVELIH